MNQVLESNINTCRIPKAVKMVRYRDKPYPHERENLLNVIAHFNIVSSEPGKVFYHNAADLIPADFLQEASHPGALKAHSRDTIVNKFSDRIF